MIVYGGFFFDLLIVPFLLWKRTRNYAFVLFCGFHIFNSYTFRIGIFPWLSIALGLFFLDPARLRQLFFKNKPAHMDALQAPRIIKYQRAAVYIIGMYLLVQVLLPLRSAFYPGNVFWTEEGYRMSWKMMLRSKTGKIFFKVTDPASRQSWYVHPADKFEASHVQCMAIAPDIVWQYAQRLKKEYAAKGYPLAEVFAIDSVSLNRNPPRLLIDTTVNLAAVRWHPFQHSTWIMPFSDHPK
jgi:hypothetical protein